MKNGKVDTPFGPIKRTRKHYQDAVGVEKALSVEDATAQTALRREKGGETNLMTKPHGFHTLTYSIDALIKEVTMLGKLRSVFLAVIVVAMAGTGAKAAEIQITGNYDVNAGINTTDHPDGIRISGPNGELTNGTTPGVTTITTGSDKASGNKLGNITLVGDGAQINESVATGSITFQNLNEYQQASIIIAAGSGTKTITGDINAASPNATSFGFDLKVLSDLNLGAGTTLTVDNLLQTGGTIQNLGATGTIIASDANRMSYIHGSSAVYTSNATFQGGAMFYDGATLKGTNNIITLGNTKGLYFQNATMDMSDSGLTVNGAATNSVNFQNGSQLILGAKANNAGTYTLTLSADVTAYGDIASAVQLSDGFVSSYYDANGYNVTVPLSHQFIDGAINTTGTTNWTVNSVFGSFGFHYDATGGWLDSYTKSNINDLDQVATQLRKNFTDSLITAGIAADTSAVANDILANHNAGTTSTMAYNNAGRFNYAAIEAMALGNSTFTWENNGVTRSGVVDKGLVAAMNGSNLSGVNYVAQDAARDIFTSLHARLDAYRAVYADVQSNVALGSPADALNDRYYNRLWAGGLGSWMDADKRKGHEGYKYDGKGVMLGYDRAVGAAFFGIAGAYIEGDYEDKAAASHDSEIKSYSANAYLTYSAANGFFATLSGGWVYSDNDIREHRGGQWTTQDYHTNTWHAEAKIGHDFQPCDNWVISPSLGVNFIHAKGSAHDLVAEGVGSIRNYSSAKNHLVEIPFDIQAEYEVAISDTTRVTFMANGGYAYNLNDHAIRGMSITDGLHGVEAAHVVGRKLGHSSWKAGAGVKFRHDQWDVGVKYDYYGRDKYNNHRLMGSIGFSF